MIYIPIETQLSWIREDLEFIRNSLSGSPIVQFTSNPAEQCPDCNYNKAIWAPLSPPCSLHAPEFTMRVDIPCE